MVHDRPWRLYERATDLARMVPHRIATRAVAMSKILPSQFSPVHHRPAPRRFPGLLRPSGAADAAYRFDRGARHRVRPVLCRKPGLPAEPRQPDDRADAVGARCAQQRHSAVDGGGDLRRSAARRRLQDRAGRQEPSAELHAARPDHQAAAAARGLSRAVAGPHPGAARSSRRSEVRAGDAGVLDQARRAHADAILRLRSCDAGAGAWRRRRRRLRPLARCARSQSAKSAGSEEQPAA